jgi:alpha-acetolactate decarboxylase
MRKKKASAATEQPTETKEAALKRIAGKRVPKAVKAISVLGNLASYKPTPAQAQAIVDEIERATKAVKARLLSGTQAAAEFVLPE